MPKYQSTKTYGNDVGISCCFRQPKATHSHCSLLHGYALGFKFVFEAETLDELNWVMDFGGLKELKQRLLETFDHKLAVAGDDPMLDRIVQLEHQGIADVVIFPSGVGCEKFAERAYHIAVDVVRKSMAYRRVRVVSCECSEHGANSATYFGE